MTLQLHNPKRLAIALVLFLTSISALAQESVDRAQSGSATTAKVIKGEPSAASTLPGHSGEGERVETKTIPVEKAGGAVRPAEGASSQGGSPDKWHFQFTPYLFMASLKGDVGARGLTTEVDARFGDIIDELNFGFMSTFEARKNKFVSLTDVQYLNFSDTQQTGPLFSSVKADFKAFILDQEVGYRLVDSDAGSLDLLGGFRYWYLRTELDFREGVLPAREAIQSKNWADAVGGLRGRARLSERWFLTGKMDFGGGGSDFTYQFFGGAGATVGKRGTLVFGYRYLKVDYDDDQGFLFDTSMKGPMIGFGLRF